MLERADPLTGLEVELDETLRTRNVSMHVDGLAALDDITASGGRVGRNPDSLAAPGETREYAWHADAEGIEAKAVSFTGTN